MSDLVRFGVAMDRALLGDFDRRIAARGYENRSEALRDLVRADLTRAAWDGGATVAATLTLVYERDARELVARLTDPDGETSGTLLASSRVPLDGDRCLEVLALRGRADGLLALSGRLGGTRGVLSSELVVAAPLPERGSPR